MEPGSLAASRRWGGGGSCASAHEFPLLSQPRLPGLLGNFPPLSPAAWESMTCVTSGGRRGLETPGPEEPELSLPGTFIVSASVLLRVCAAGWEWVNAWSCVCPVLQGLKPGVWVSGSFFWGGGRGGLGWWQVLLETWRKLAALPFFFPSQGSKPRTSGTGGESKAPSISFINKAN